MHAHSLRIALTYLGRLTRADAFLNRIGDVGKTLELYVACSDKDTADNTTWRKSANWEPDAAYYQM